MPTSIVSHALVGATTTRAGREAQRDIDLHSHQKTQSAKFVSTIPFLQRTNERENLGEGGERRKVPRSGCAGGGRANEPAQRGILAYSLRATVHRLYRRVYKSRNKQMGDGVFPVVCHVMCIYARWSC